MQPLSKNKKESKRRCFWESSNEARAEPIRRLWMPWLLTEAFGQDRDQNLSAINPLAELCLRMVTEKKEDPMVGKLLLLKRRSCFRIGRALRVMLQLRREL